VSILRRRVGGGDVVGASWSRVHGPRRSPASGPAPPPPPPPPAKPPPTATATVWCWWRAAWAGELRPLSVRRASRRWAPPLEPPPGRRRLACRTPDPPGSHRAARPRPSRSYAVAPPLTRAGWAALTVRRTRERPAGPRRWPSCLAARSIRLGAPSGDPPGWSGGGLALRARRVPRWLLPLRTSRRRPRGHAAARRAAPWWPPLESPDDPRPRSWVAATVCSPGPGSPGAEAPPGGVASRHVRSRSTSTAPDSGRRSRVRPSNATLASASGSRGLGDVPRVSRPTTTAETPRRACARQVPEPKHVSDANEVRRAAAVARTGPGSSASPAQVWSAWRGRASPSRGWAVTDRPGAGALPRPVRGPGNARVTARVASGCPVRTRCIAPPYTRESVHKLVNPPVRRPAPCRFQVRGGELSRVRPARFVVCLDASVWSRPQARTFRGDPRCPAEHGFAAALPTPSCLFLTCGANRGNLTVLSVVAASAAARAGRLSDADPHGPAAPRFGPSDHRPRAPIGFRIVCHGSRGNVRVPQITPPGIGSGPRSPAGGPDDRSASGRFVDGFGARRS